MIIIFTLAFVNASCHIPMSPKHTLRSVKDSPIIFKTGSRSGRVVDAVTGKPIEGAVVCFEWDIREFLIELTTLYGTYYETLTDEKGEYFIPSQSIKSGGGLWAGLEPEEVLIYKYGYVVYMVSRNKVDPVMRYMPKLRQKYRRKNNSVKLQPWIDELSHEDHIEIVGHWGWGITRRKKLLAEAIKREEALAEREGKRPLPRGKVPALTKTGDNSGIPLLIELAKRHVYRNSFEGVFYSLRTAIYREDIECPKDIPGRKKLIAKIERWWEQNKDKTRVEMLGELAVNSKIEPVQRRKALRELGRLKDKSAIPWLIQSLKDRFVSYEAIQSLVEIGDKRAVPHIKKFLGHRDVRWQRTAAIALHKLGDDSGVAVIIKSLKSWDKDTRCTAEHTLSQLTGQNFTEGKRLSSFSREKEKEIIQRWLDWWEQNRSSYE